MIQRAQTNERMTKDTFKTQVLLIDDELAVRRYLRIILEAENFDVYEATTAKIGLVQVQTHQPHIVLLDLQLPDDVGTHVIKAIHEIQPVPILVISLQDDVACKIDALDAGAEDYIVKPFDTGELLARIRVALRRSRVVDETDVFRSGNLEVDFVRRTVKVSGELLNLTITEYELLRCLIIHAGQPVTHQQLWLAVRNDIATFDAHTLRVHMSNLRRKLETDPKKPEYILTEISIGYRFQVLDT